MITIKFNKTNEEDCIMLNTMENSKIESKKLYLQGGIDITFNNPDHDFLISTDGIYNFTINSIIELNYFNMKIYKVLIKNNNQYIVKFRKVGDE